LRAIATSPASPAAEATRRDISAAAVGRVGNTVRDGQMCEFDRVLDTFLPIERARLQPVPSRFQVRRAHERLAE